MGKGRNKADKFDKILWQLEAKENKDRPCIFLSHKKEDKPACRVIADYFKNAEIDYYLDELDENLQRAANANDPELITASIKKGIRESSHMLVVVSEKTIKSQWVPFEIGYGHAMIVDKNLNDDKSVDLIRLATLTLKDLSEKELPDFIRTSYLIRGTKSLNEYIKDISSNLYKSMFTENQLPPYSKSTHPLDEILNWAL
jgi:hypothetical protein